MVRRIHRRKLHRRKIHIERRHTERGHTQIKDIYGVGTNIKGWNLYCKGNTRIRDYTEKEEGTNMGGEDIFMEGGGEIYSVRRLYGMGIKQKRARKYTWRGDTHGRVT